MISVYLRRSRGANVTSDHALLRADSALCPADITQFRTDYIHNQFVIDSDLEVYITSC